MKNKNILCSFDYCGWHKGFYNDDNFRDSLLKIEYADFFKLPDDDEFPYSSAYDLLCGSCNYFALSLQKIFGYSPYIIEGISTKGFHAFCQIYRNREWYYVDARGITSSFDEFMDMAKKFVTGEYIIRPVNPDDIADWESNSNYIKEAHAFSEAVIKKYIECYVFEE